MTSEQRYPNRLIEVDLPIKRISAHARREKSIRHGHISTLHIWWARRPLAACRAVLCAALWPDPADPLCPESFREAARNEMRAWATTHIRLLSPESFQRFNAIAKGPKKLDDLVELRKALLDFVADFANWDSSIVKEYLDTSRALTQAAHEALGGQPGTRPLVVDPFAGGGAIPLEALRVGADAYASDLNSVAVLLNKVMLEYIPKYGQRLADEVRKWGAWFKQEAEKDLAEFYPKDPDGAAPIAYLWARTIQCEGPGCGVEVPLVRSFLLGKRGVEATGLSLEIDSSSNRIRTRIETSKTAEAFERGTLRRGSATCPACGYSVPGPRVRKQAAAQNGGANCSRLLAVVCQSAKGRFYREPTKRDLEAFEKSHAYVSNLRTITLDDGTPLIPNEELPYLRSIFNVNLIGINRWALMFTSRQLASLVTLTKLVRSCYSQLKEQDEAFATAVSTVLALAVDRQADYSSSICTWVQSGEFIGHTFAQNQALPIKWDFAEVVPFGSGSGSWDGAVGWVCRVLENIVASRLQPGDVHRASAVEQALPNDAANFVFTDPPYYDAVPYADLSDFFYVWLKRSIGSLHPTLFQTEATQKDGEIVQLAERNPIYAFKTRKYFEALMVEALSESRRVAAPDGMAVIVFAHKETAAWEAMLQAVISAGWVVTASWPIDTEMGARLRAHNSAALASSVHLVCRPRENPDGSIRAEEVGDWREVLRELPRRIHDWMPRLAEEGVVGADAIFACLGPALEVYSRHSRVEKTSGEVVTLGEYLEHVWAAVSKEAMSMIFRDAETSGLEPDARLTAMWLWTLAATTGNGVADPGETPGTGDAGEEDEDSEPKAKTIGFTLEFDAARKIAQGLGAHLETLGNLVEIKGDKARLLPVAERTKYLFGKDVRQQTPASRRGKPKQMTFFAELEVAEQEAGWGETGTPSAGNTTLDRVHQAMILFAAGRADALKRFVVEEGVGRDAKMWKLAQSLSALYPAGTDEKRWVDGVLARKKSLGF